MAAKIFGKFFSSLANKEINLNTDSLKAMLVTNAFVPDQDVMQYKSSVTNEVVGNGYVAGGQVLTAVTVVYNPATNTLTLDFADPSWPASDITARHIVFYDNTPATDATRPLVAWDDFGVDKISSAGAFTYTCNVAGAVAINVA